MASNNGFGSALLGHYDKLVAVVGLVFLGLAAFLFVGGRAATESEAQNFKGKIKKLVPANPEVAGVASRVDAYAVPLSRVSKPLQIANDRTRKVGFFVPEMRIWCVRNDCRFPLGPEWKKCPICNTEQDVRPIEAINADSDGDGLPDEWERKYGLNPQDPADAELDSDEDGFTNLQEFKDGTDPLEAKSHKDFVTLLRVVKVEATILPLKFTGASRMPNGKFKCTFNYAGVNPVSKRAESFTLWVNEGDPIGKSQGVETGFILVKLNEDAEEVVNKSTGMRVKVPTATVSRGDKTFTLSQDKVANDTDYIITLAKDFGDNGEITIDGGKDFKVGEKVYHVVKADKDTLNVVIRCDADKSEVTLTRDGAAK
jgi:hypothetical protein